MKILIDFLCPLADMDNSLALVDYSPRNKLNENIARQNGENSGGLMRILTRVTGLSSCRMGSSFRAFVRFC
jgi:hypothetical protein